MLDAKVRVWLIEYRVKLENETSPLASVNRKNKEKAEEIRKYLEDDLHEKFK